ncbi:MAG TPA: thiol reductant ABC exporter subunit CydC [Gaiellaceae bacterium]|nr:thiol reductant ABC exporter subunit CydC [Gaiellaceae bacterium]
MTVRRLLALGDASSPRLALSISLGAATVLCGVGLMATAGYLISRAAERPDVLALAVAIVGVRFFGLARPIFRYFERLSSHDLAFRVLSRVRVRAYERMEPLAPAQLAGYRRGDLLSRMVADVDALQNLYLRGLGPPLVALVAGAVSVVAATIILPAAGLVLTIGLFLAAVAGTVGRRGHGREAAARGELSAELVELMEGAPELVVFGAQDDRLERLRAADRSLVAIRRKSARSDGLGDALRLAVTGCTVVGVLIGAVAASDLDPTLLAALGLLALASFEAVTPLSRASRELSETLAAGQRVLELTDQRALVVDPAAPARAPIAPFTVALENVSVRYPGAERRALEDVTLRLDPGRKIALVGPSGAGKTTVTNLLLRFLDPECGRVVLAGRDVRDYRQEDVRRAIAVAGQDAYLFATSIRENVRLARPEADDGEIEAALRRARIWEWVQELPAGWDTPVGENGHELSGGQRQRIVLARALLADAPLLVLDEPTAHLDATTAQRLVEDVVAAVGDRTLLLITHRPEGLELVDEVFALQPPLVG